MGPGKPGSPGMLWHFPGLESPGKRPLLLEGSGNLLNSTKKYEVYGRQFLKKGTNPDLLIPIHLSGTL